MPGSGGFQVLCLELEPDLMSCSTTGVRFVLMANIFPNSVFVEVVVISQRLCRSQFRRVYQFQSFSRTHGLCDEFHYPQYTIITPCNRVTFLKIDPQWDERHARARASAVGASWTALAHRV